MNTLSDTDEGRTRPSVWPAYLAAVVLVPVGASIGSQGVGLALMSFGGEDTVGLLERGTEAIVGLSAYGLLAAMGLLGLVAAVGLAGLRPWGWWCTAVFAASWAMVCLLVVVWWLLDERPFFFAAPSLGLLTLLVLVLTTRRQLFFPPKPEGEGLPSEVGASE